MIELRRRYSGGVQSPSHSRLPAGYQEVEYLENTYDARLYFPVDFQTNDIISVETSFMITGRFSLYRDMCIIGVGGANKFALTISRNGNSFRYEIPNYPDRRYVDIYNDVAYDTEYSIKINTINGSYVNDNLITNEVIKGNDYYSGGVYIFNRGPLFQEPFLGRLKELVLKTTTDTFHFIPCYRTTDRVAGMYDIVNDVFYPNAGTGEFLVGQDVHYNIPPEYQQVEYLEVANANTAQLPVNQATFIDTGVIADRNTSFYIDYEFKGIYSVTLQNQVGAGAGDSGRFYISIDNNKIGCAIGVDTTTDIPIETNKRFQAELNAYKDTLTVLVDGAEYVRNIDTDSFVSSVLPISLFGRRENSSTISFCFGARAYACIIKNQDEPVRNFIPCYRKEDNEAGMYDLVSGEFYTNAGTGTFEVGPLVI